MKKSLGILEVKGMVTATACIDAMVKSSYIEIYHIERLGSGMITILIEGEVAAVNIALEIGAEEAFKHGELIATKTIAKPDQKLIRLFTQKKQVDIDEKG